MHDNRCKPMIKYSTFYLIITSFFLSRSMTFILISVSDSWMRFSVVKWAVRSLLAHSLLILFLPEAGGPRMMTCGTVSTKEPKHVNNFKLTNTYMQSYFLFDQSRLIYIYSCNFKLTNTCMLSCFLFYQSRLIYNNSCKIHVYALPFLTPLSLERGGGV